MDIKEIVDTIEELKKNTQNTIKYAIELKNIIDKKDNMIIELTNTIEELENELNAYKNNKSEEECTLGYEAYGVCDHGDITD